MAQPFTASLSHRLGKDEATRRIQSGLTTARTRFSRHVTIVEETWVGDHLDFRLVVLGQSANGTLDVTEEAIHLAVELPFLLNLMAQKAKSLIRKEGQLMLEKK